MSNPLAQFTAQQKKAWVTDKLLEREEEICRLYFDEGFSEPEVARRMNYNERSVNIIIKKAAKLNPDRAANRKRADYDPRKIENRVPLSPAHVKLGLLITRFISNNRLHTGSFGLMVGMNRSSVSHAISGSHDFKLTELVAVTNLLEIPVEEIFKGMHNGPIRATPPDPFKFRSGGPTFGLPADQPVSPGNPKGGPGHAGNAHPDNSDASDSSADQH